MSAERRSRGSAIAAVALLLACGSASAQPFVRTVAPFTVERTSGEAFINPFSGGLWQPRTGLRDIDGDGRPDLFTLNPDGELRLYRNEGSFLFRRALPSPYDGLPLNNWFRFVDLDGDGAAELLTAGSRSEVMVLENDGTDAAPLFRLPARPLVDATGATIYMQRETVPSLVDIDGDGDNDLFSGNLDGSITFYRNTGTRTAPVFTFETATYEDILVAAPIRTRDREDDAPAAIRGDDGRDAAAHTSERSGGALHAGARHGASVLDFADLDGDGDLDILFGDYFTRKLLHFENTGTAAVADFGMDRLDTAFRPAGDDVESEGFNQPVTGDIDGDGDLDVIVSSLHPVTDAAPLLLYENVGSAGDPLMRRRSIDLTSEIDLGRFAAPASIDDAQRHGMLVGASNGRLTYIERVASTPVTRFRVAATIALPELYQTVPAAGDLDGDGIAEVLVGEANGAIIFHRFAGATLERYGEPLQLNRNASPALVDLDGDGDLDIFSGAENGRFAYFENTGTRTAATFTRATPPEPFATLDVGYDSAPRFFDLDGDGVEEVIVGGRTGGATGGRDTLRFFERFGAGYIASTRFPAMAVARNPVALGMRLAEGTFLFVGDLSGGIVAFVDSAHASAAEAPSVAGGLRIGFEASAVVVERSAGPARSTVVRVLDALGRVVIERPLGASERRVRIELGRLASGTYLVEAAGAGERVTAVVPIVR